VFHIANIEWWDDSDRMGKSAPRYSGVSGLRRGWEGRHSGLPWRHMVYSLLVG